MSTRDPVDIAYDEYECQIEKDRDAAYAIAEYKADLDRSDRVTAYSRTFIEAMEAMEQSLKNYAIAGGAK